MNAFTSYLEKLGSNFLVASFVPSLALAIIGIFVFDPILNIATAFRNPQDTPQLIILGISIFIFIVIIGFTLTALNTYILKIYEGYVKLPLIEFIYNKSLKIHRHNARSLKGDRDSIAKEIERLDDIPNRNSDQEKKLENLKDRYYKIASSYDQTYPDNLDDILPTQFGNTLRAAEDHSAQRYGFDGVTFWPRLVHVIPDGYKMTIDSSRNELSFLVNMSLLSGIFTSLCVLAMFYTMGKTNVVSANPNVFLSFIGEESRYLIAAVLGMVSGVFFYKASIISLGTFANTIRASFDLFRLDLLTKLELIRPNNSIEEFNTWRNINELILLGTHSLSFDPLEYRKEKQGTEEKG